MDSEATNYYVYEIDYPEEGGDWFTAVSEDEAKHLYNTMTGFPLPLDKLEALEQDTAMGIVEGLELPATQETPDGQ